MYIISVDHERVVARVVAVFNQAASLHVIGSP